MTHLFRWLLPYRDIGWAEIGEEFTRFTIFSTRWLTLYLHRIKAPVPHTDCHDHPWSFVTIILKGGYFEYSETEPRWHWRAPGTILYRPAEFAHNVFGANVAWSLVFVGPKRREWGFKDCR